MTKEELGDWQTPISLALRVCHLLKQQGIHPTTIIEPTCGRGNFIRAALRVFDSIHTVYAIDIYQPYIKEVGLIETQYPNVTFNIYNQSVFDFDFSCIADTNLLVIGNPPWVTNSHMGSIKGDNLPPKKNIKRHKGLEAITGKGNFDISEFIMRSLFKSLSDKDGVFAVLLKNSVIRQLVYGDIEGREASCFRQYKIDAKKEFGASTAASLFVGRLGEIGKNECQVFDFYTLQYLRSFGIVDQLPVSDLEMYKKYSMINGESPFIWRSGIKHDCAKIMELSRNHQGHYINGLKQEVLIEDELVYPLVKSSDINKKKKHRKYLLLTQKKTTDETSYIQEQYPRAFDYLQSHARYLDERKSSIYRKRPRFCLFGVGDYSFYPYKIAISSLYRDTTFVLLDPINGKPTMIDDTCYAIGFKDKELALTILSILNSSPVQNFIRSISPCDAKRIITKDILMRIDIAKAINLLNENDLDITLDQKLKVQQYLQSLTPPTLFNLQ